MPRKAVAEVRRLLDDAPETIAVEASDSKIVFRIGEAVVGVLVTSVLFFSCARASSGWACVARDGGPAWTRDSKYAMKFDCGDGEVHELASLWFGSREEAIKKILEGERGDFTAKGLLVTGVLSRVAGSLARFGARSSSRRLSLESSGRYPP